MVVLEPDISSDYLNLYLEILTDNYKISEKMFGAFAPFRLFATYLRSFPTYFILFTYKVNARGLCL